MILKIQNPIGLDPKYRPTQIGLNTIIIYICIYIYFAVNFMTNSDIHPYTSNVLQNVLRCTIYRYKTILC